MKKSDYVITTTLTEVTSYIMSQVPTMIIAIGASLVINAVISYIGR